VFLTTPNSCNSFNSFNSFHSHVVFTWVRAWELFLPPTSTHHLLPSPAPRFSRPQLRPLHRPLRALQLPFKLSDFRAFSLPPDLQTSRPQTSIPARLHVSIHPSTPPDLHASTPPYLRASRPPDLQTFPLPPDLLAPDLLAPSRPSRYFRMTGTSEMVGRNQIVGRSQMLGTSKMVGRGHMPATSRMLGRSQMPGTGKMMGRSQMPGRNQMSGMSKMVGTSTPARLHTSTPPSPCLHVGTPTGLHT
jgi:hypothetical protein